MKIFIYFKIRLHKKFDKKGYGFNISSIMSYAWSRGTPTIGNVSYNHSGTLSIY